VLKTDRSVSRNRDVSALAILAGGASLEWSIPKRLDRGFDKMRFSGDVTSGYLNSPHWKKVKTENFLPSILV
jgi:hypothetical protein